MPTLMHQIHHYYMKEPYHTSILSGYAWLQEMLHGHPEHICTEFGVHKEVFHALIRELQSMGHGDTKYVTLEEQLAIFLYTLVTGLSIWHVGEQFQHANGTISKWVLWIPLHLSLRYAFPFRSSAHHVLLLFHLLLPLASIFYSALLVLFIYDSFTSFSLSLTHLCFSWLIPLLLTHSYLRPVLYLAFLSISVMVCVLL